jgi:hypothetical protein
MSPMASENAYAAVALGERGRARVLAQRVQSLRTRDSELLLGVGLAVVAIALLAMLPHAILQDTWLALVAGRDIAANGIPHHDVLTAFSAGRPWIDQQWLSQLLMYRVYQVGGIALVGVLSMGLLSCGIGGAMVGARKLGAAPASIIRIFPLALLNILVATEVRTQAFVYPLLVGVLYLLATDSRRPSRRVYLSLPLLVLWGNLHGSVVVGVALVVLRALTLLWERRERLRSAAAWLPPALLAGGAVLSLLVTPYGVAALSYYRGTLLNGSFRQFSVEWQPVTAAPLLVIIALLTLASLALWSFGRYRRQTTLWDRGTLIGLAFASVMVMRNVEWFGLAALMLMPVSIDPAARAAAHRSRSRPGVNLLLAAIAGTALIGMLALTLGKPPASFEAGYPSGALSAIRATVDAQPSIWVYADEQFGDWLLWRIPQLRGRVAYDARFELLSSAQLRQIGDLKLQMGPAWRSAARGYRLLVLPSGARPLVRSFEAEPGARTVFNGEGTVVILRRPANPAPSSSET